MKAPVRRFLWIGVALLIAAAIGYAFVPKPIEVDLSHVDRGAMKVTVDQDGKTRVKERYIISAPLTGHLRRITLDEGDRVKAGETILATIDPTPPSLLDSRAWEETEARVRAAEAALAQAEPAVVRAQAELEQARIESNRIGQMATRQAASQEEAERMRLSVTARDADLKSAQSAREVAKFQLQQAQAALRHTSSSTTSPSDATAPFEIRAPIDGQILRVLQESQGLVTPGTPLLEVGDIGQLEAVIDVLSRDAVKIRPGAAASLERWGGGEPIEGVVRRVEPSGFTKISALGVEEQRVNVIIDFPNTTPDGQPVLGDGYRVDARIVVWQKPDVLKVPTGALFRDGEEWAVYAIENGNRRRAVLRRVRLGQMNDLEAEVLEGLSEAQPVILHPSDKVKDGVKVKARGR